MAGLLDFLNTDDARLGLGLLAAGGPSTVPMSVGQRVAGALQGMDADKQNKLRLGLLQSQIDENSSQAALRASQIAKQGNIQQMTAGLLGDMGGTSMGGGSNVAPAAPAGVPAATAAGLRGIPIERVAALKAAGGPDLIDAWKAVNIPTALSAGSYAFTPGAAPTYMADPSKGLGIGPQGVYVLPGAGQAQADLTRQTERAKAEEQARFQEATPTISPDGRKTITSRLDQYGSGRVTPMAGPAGNVQSPGYSGGDRNSANAESIRIIQSEMLKPGNTPEDMAGLRREMQRLQMQSGQPVISAPAGNVVELSPAEQAANEAAKTKAVGTASADVARETAAKAEGKRGAQMGEVAKIANQLLDAGPTGSGIGALADTAGNFIGRPMKGATQAQQLEALSGWLTANIPRMEGPQSDADVRNYATMAGKIGDRTLPAETRKAALATLLELQGKYADLNGGAAKLPGQATDKPKTVLSDLPKTATVGSRVRDTQTGKILRFDGLKWKEE